MILSDYWIRQAIQHGRMGVAPPPRNGAFQPASLELHLAEDVVLGPGDCLLTYTHEVVRLGPTLRGQVCGKSSIGRLFTTVHVTAGFVDPGFCGQLVLEMVNLQLPSAAVDPDEREAENEFFTQRFKAGQAVCQLELAEVLQPVLRPYGHAELGSHYQGQMGVVGSHLEVAVEAV